MSEASSPLLIREFLTSPDPRFLASPDPENFLPLLVQGEVGAIPIAPGEVQRQQTSNAYSYTRTIALALSPHAIVPLPACLTTPREGVRVRLQRSRLEN